MGNEEQFKASAMRMRFDARELSGRNSHAQFSGHTAGDLRHA
jgi:hypothetical protein